MEHCTRRQEYNPEKRKYTSDDCSSREDATRLWKVLKDYGNNCSENRNIEWNKTTQPFHGTSKDFQIAAVREREKQLSQLHQPVFQTYNFSSVDEHSYLNNQQTSSSMSTYSGLPTEKTPAGPPMNDMDINPRIMPFNPGLKSAPLTSGAEIPYDGSGHAPIKPNPMASGMEICQSNGTEINLFVPTHSHVCSNMLEMSNYCQPVLTGQKSGIVGHVKEVVKLTKSVLYPPNSNAPPRTTRDKPLGCKTVFVGGVPENITKEVIREVFERCGEIITIFMSKRNFCRIKFATESAVENAIYFSGYRIKIGNKDEPSYSGWLHVDYAQNKDDQYEYECQQRALRRATRHQEKVEHTFLKPQTPPPVVEYSEHEAFRLGEKLRGEETFQKAVSVLMIWLKKGNCNKRNAGTFYSMIQSTNSNIRRLMNEKLKYEDELNKAKMELRNKMSGILLQFQEINKLFNIACLPKAWDHFTKAQRKNIEMWKKQAEEIQNSYTEELLNERIEDDMDVSHDDEVENNESASKDTVNVSDEEKAKFNEEINKLKEQNDTLKTQLEAAENETVVLKSETNQELESKNQHIETLKQALEDATKEITNFKQKHSEDKAEVKEFLANELKIKSENQVGKIDLSEKSSKPAVSTPFSEKEARLFGLVYAFLTIHPFGAFIYEIWTYVSKMYSTIQPKDIEIFLKKFPSIFQKDSEGDDSDSSMKWKILGFHS